MFSVVVFPEEKRVDAVRSEWISNNYSSWPPYPTWSKKFKDALERGEDWTNWDKFPIRLLASFGK